MRHRLHVVYLTYLSLWPGLAVLGLQFVPATYEIWVAKLPGLLIFFGSLILLAGVALYLSFITEVLPFPEKLPEAWLAVILLPAYIIVAVLISDQTIWEAVVSGFIVECGIVLVTVASLVFGRIKQRDWNTYSIVVLLGIVVLLLSAMIPLFIHMMGQSIWLYALTLGTVITGAIQNIRHYHFSERPQSDGAKFILIGVGALIFLPLVGAILRGN